MVRDRDRVLVRLRSEVGTGHTYVTTKNRKNDPGRLQLREFDPVARRHVQYREQR